MSVALKKKKKPLEQHQQQCDNNNQKTSGSKYGKRGCLARPKRAGTEA